MKKVFLENLQNSYVTCYFIKKETLAQVFSCEFCWISKNTFFTKHLRTTASICKKFCKNSNINIVFSPFKTGDLFSSKDCLPSGLKSFVVYKFVCARCQSCYIDETKHHLPTRINEHLVTDKKPHIFKHLLEIHLAKTYVMKTVLPL